MSAKKYAYLDFTALINQDVLPHLAASQHQSNHNKDMARQGSLGVTQPYLGFDVQRVCRGELECLWGVSALSIGTCVYCGADQAVDAQLLDVMLNDEVVPAAWRQKRQRSR